MDDAQLLSRVIRIGSDREASYAVCRSLLDRFGNLRAVLQASREALVGVPQIGTIRADILLALPDIAQRYYECELHTGVAIRCPSDTESYLAARLSHLGHEVFCCLYLDNRHRVLRFDELFRGTIDGTSVYPREVVKEALAINAAAVIVAHNHPSGVAEPSNADERITQRLKAALELVDIRLLDHLVIGHGSAVSLASRGLL